MIKKFGISHFGQTAESSKHRNRQQLKADANVFSLETYFISQYIERHLKKSKLLKEKNIGSSRKSNFVQVTIGLNFEDNSFKVFPESRALYYQSKFSYDRIKNLRRNSRAEAILVPLLDSLTYLDNHIKSIIPVILEIIDNFRNENFRNVWEFARKKVKNVGTAKIMCELTQVSFQLRLILEDKNNSTIFNKPIMETMPDPLYYHHRFKSLVVSDENKIIITQRLKNDPFFSISLEDALKIGVDNTIYFEQNDIPKWWSDFKTCMQEPEGILCP